MFQDQIIFELLYTIKALFLSSLRFNEKMLDYLLCIIHQITTCAGILSYIHRYDDEGSKNEFYFGVLHDVVDS